MAIGCCLHIRKAECHVEASPPPCQCKCGQTTLVLAHVKLDTDHPTADASCVRQVMLPYRRLYPSLFGRSAGRRRMDRHLVVHDTCYHAQHRRECIQLHEAMVEGIASKDNGWIRRVCAKDARRAGSSSTSPALDLIVDRQCL